jgi:hypothetical protein
MEVIRFMGCGRKNKKGRTSLPLFYFLATNYLEAAEAAEAAEAEAEADALAFFAFGADAEADAEAGAEAAAEAEAGAEAVVANAEAANRPAIRAAISFIVCPSN